MKNQYFGDINDYRKYGFLRALTQHTELRLCVNWMLTPDDGRTDGNQIDYLKRPKRWASLDPNLFEYLRECVLTNGDRRVSLIERSGLLHSTTYFSEKVPRSQSKRNLLFQRMLSAADDCDLVFLDPDNGIEVPSTPYGQRGSEKYVYWREIRCLFNHGYSLLIYQHFPRVERSTYIANIVDRLTDELKIDEVIAIESRKVLFLLMPQRSQKETLKNASMEAARIWGDQLQIQVIQAITERHHPLQEDPPR